MQNTPTFSFSFAFIKDFPAAKQFLLSASPIRVLSTIFTSTLSTPPTNTHSVPSFFICSNTPDLSIDSKTPPCPSEASLTKPFSSTSNFPSNPTIGSSPCIKNVTFSFG